MGQRPQQLTPERGPRHEWGARLRSLREDRQMSLAALGSRVHQDPSYLARVERGERPPTADLADHCDQALEASGALRELAQVLGLGTGNDRAERTSEPHPRVPGEQVRAAAADSMDMAEWAMADRVDQPRIEHFAYELARVAVEYVHSPVQPLFCDLQELRDDARALLQSRPHPTQARELWFLAGVTVTLLAHASQNMGESMAAARQAMAAERLAEQADHPGLRGWVAGTRALIAEWTGQPSRAAEFARQGSLYVPNGDGAVRLAAMSARASARAGDSDGARDDLRRMRDAAEKPSPPQPDELTEMGGVLSFPSQKAWYYAGSTHALLGEYVDAERLATAAIAAYETGPTEQRSYGDEALARVDLADARLGQDDLEGAAVALGPVLSMPPEQRITQVVDRLHRIAGNLRSSRYVTTSAARELTDDIMAFSSSDEHSASHRRRDS